MSEELKDSHSLEIPLNTHEIKIIDETNPTDESKKTEEPIVEGQKIPYDRFKQKVDEANALKEKLAEIKEAQAEKERKELEEQNEYKTLYEQALEEIAQEKAKLTTARKTTALASAGYDAEQIELLSKLVAGESEEEINESIETIKAKFPIRDNYADPSPFNGPKGKPKAVDAEEVGRNAVSRVIHKIRL